MNTEATTPDSPELRNAQAVYMLRNMLGNGVLDIPAVIAKLEGRK